jgi:acyl-coenzyme A thioesterase PaaI-like protein
MDILKIPFVEKVGIQHDNRGLNLPFRSDNLNHIGTTHASAIFTLAESASGEALQNFFPEYVGKVIPVLRDSQIKFKKPTTEVVHAFSSVSDEDTQTFKTQLDKKGRALINVQIEVKDDSETVVCIGTFTWFVQMIDEK